MHVRSAAVMLGVAAVVVTIACGSGGCEPDRSTSVSRPATDMFAPTGMRIHPIFTQVEDWTKDGKPDGIEAQLEFQDQFDDPTKASGRVLFELFEYRRDSPDPRGRRVAGPWVGSLVTLDEQHERWNTTLRSYRFQLAYPEIRYDANYVLTAVFEMSGGGRFFDRVILTARQPPQSQQQSTIQQEQTGGSSARPNYTGEPTSRSSQP
jgi:hypothetical protein